MVAERKSNMAKEIKQEIINEIIRIGIQMDQKGMVNAFEEQFPIVDLVRQGIL